MTTKHHKAMGHHMQKAMHHMAQAHKHHSGHEIMQNEDGTSYGTHATMKGNVTASDTSGERKEKLIHHMVADAKENRGSEHKFDGGRHESVCYTHTRDAYK